MTAPRFRPLLLGMVLVAVLSSCSDDGSTSSESQNVEANADPTVVTTTTVAQPAVEPFVSEQYADLASWVCHADLAENPCTTDLDLTVLSADGSTEAEPHVVAEDPPIDCFYLYPTVNISADGVAGFDGDYGIEVGITRTQAARFSSVCRVFAPLYRQTTFGSGPDIDREALRAQAYADVEESFRHYLANDNDGRPFVLMGHSQGSGLGTQLLQDLADDGEPLADQLVSALLIGTSITAPAGADVGGTFATLPACRAEDQTGCIVTYASFDVSAPPGEGWGSTDDPSQAALCTNPAALSGGSAVLQMIDPTGPEPLAELGVAITTPYVALPDFVTGECLDRDGLVYLGITVQADDGIRTDDLRSDTSLPWGLHPIDYNLALGDLVDLVAAQSDAFHREGG